MEGAGGVGGFLLAVEVVEGLEEVVELLAGVWA